MNRLVRKGMGNAHMKIAAITDDGETISQHFGQAEQFVVVTVENGEVVGREMHEIAGHPGFDAEHSGELEHEHVHRQGQHRGSGLGKGHRYAHMIATIAGCDVVLARSMGTGMHRNLREAGLRPIVTTVVNIDEAVTAYLEGRLEDHPERLH